ncbi:MAG: TetR family transcriptional regulator C-terminal domain-containing protein [Desulfosalsimonas sp.]
MESYEPTKSERTRRYIIEKAAPVINKKGAAGTSIADLAEATGLTKGGIYGNFKSKEELVAAVYDYHAETINRIFRKQTANAETPGQKLAAYPSFFSELYKFMKDYGGCPVLNTAAEADDTNPVLRRKVSETVLLWKKQAADLIKAGIKQGEIKPDTDPERSAALMLSLFEGAGVLSGVTGDSSFEKEAIGQIHELICGMRA